MSDIFWILLVVLAYIYFIAPLFKGIVGVGDAKKTNNKNSSTKASKTEQGDYVDYEELK